LRKSITPNTVTARREFLLGGVGVALATSPPVMQTIAAAAEPAASTTPNHAKGNGMSAFTTKDGVEIYYKD
jgi:hypothetical protein